MLARSEYVTAAGSRVRPVRKASWDIVFNWLEEGACFEAVPEVDADDGALFWSCACCDETGRAPLKRKRKEIGGPDGHGENSEQTGWDR